MHFATSTFSWPDVNDEDSDRSLSFDLEAEVENSSEVDIALVKTSVTVLSPSGVGLGGSFDDHSDCEIRPGESEPISISCGWSTNKDSFEASAKEIKAIVNLGLYGRTSHKLGEVLVPSGPGSSAEITDGINFGEKLQVLGGSCITSAPDDDDELLIQLNVAIQNTSNSYFERVSVQMVLKDPDGKRIASGAEYGSIAPKNSLVLMSSLYTKDGNQNDATLEVEVSVYQCLENISQTVTFTLDGAQQEQSQEEDLGKSSTEVVSTPDYMNKKQAIDLVNENGMNLSELSDEFKSDREVVLKAIENNVYALEHAHDSLKKNKEFILEALTSGADFQYVDDILKADREVILMAIECDNAHTLEYCDESFTKDKEVVMASLTEYSGALEYVHDSLKNDKEFILEAVQNIKDTGQSINLDDLNENLQDDPDILAIYNS